MFKPFLSAALIYLVMLLPHNAAACGLHSLYLDPDQMGFFGGAAVRLAGLAPPEPVFKIKHPPMKRVPVGEMSAVSIEYDRPWFSSDVKIQLSSSSGVKLEEKSFELNDFDGAVKVNFSLEKDGYNTIMVKVSGTHKGEKVVKSSMIYIRASKPPKQQSASASL